MQGVKNANISNIAGGCELKAQVNFSDRLLSIRLSIRL